MRLKDSHQPQTTPTRGKFVFPRVLLSLLVIFFITGCASSQEWHYQRIATGELDYDSLKVIYPARDKANDIEVEILKTSVACILSLSVHGQPIPSCENDPQHTLVRVKIADKCFTELATLHAGGQRLKLSASLQETILTQLRAGGAVEIELSGYKRIIAPANFPDLVGKIDDPPHFRNPIRLPF